MLKTKENEERGSDKERGRERGGVGDGRREVARVKSNEITSGKTGKTIGSNNMRHAAKHPKLQNSIKLKLGKCTCCLVNGTIEIRISYIWQKKWNPKQPPYI